MEILLNKLLGAKSVTFTIEKAVDDLAEYFVEFSFIIGSRVKHSNDWQNFIKLSSNNKTRCFFEMKWKTTLPSELLGVFHADLGVLQRDLNSKSH